MTASDMFGFALFCGFGLWWLIAPRSVAAFYSWFTPGKAKIPSSIAIRLIGVAWSILVAAVVMLGRKR